MFSNHEYTGKEIKILQEDDDSSSHAEMVVKALGAFSTATNMKISWAVNTIKEYGLVVRFRNQEDIDQLKEGRKTLDRFVPYKVDPYKDPESYAGFCNKINTESTRGEFMASIINVVMDHIPGKKRYATIVDTAIPEYLDALFCFDDRAFCDRIEVAHKFIHTTM
jgi:hypothetical protein